MKQKTQVHAQDGKQEILITRAFDLPVELLFKAYSEPEYMEQWMENKVLKLKCKKHGSYQLEKKDARGNVVFGAHGVIHEVVPNQKITRTFEMDNAPFGVQLEFYEFEKRTEKTSRLAVQMIFKSVELRNQLLKLPFARGLSMGHDRLQEIMNQSK